MLQRLGLHSHTSHQGFRPRPHKIGLTLSKRMVLANAKKTNPIWLHSRANNTPSYRTAISDKTTVRITATSHAARTHAAAPKQKIRQSIRSVQPLSLGDVV